MSNANAGEVTQLVTSDSFRYTVAVLCGATACLRRSSRVCMGWAIDRAWIMWITEAQQINLHSTLDGCHLSNHATYVRQTHSRFKDYDNRSYNSNHLSAYPHSRRSATAPPATAAPSHWLETNFAIQSDRLSRSTLETCQARWQAAAPTPA